MYFLFIGEPFDGYASEFSNFSMSVSYACARVFGLEQGAALQNKTGSKFLYAYQSSQSTL